MPSNSIFDRVLTNYAIARRNEFTRQDHLINTFEKARTQLAMNTDREIDNIAANPVDILHPDPSAPSAPLRELKRLSQGLDVVH
jgi:hypothetical protein